MELGNERFRTKESTSRLSETNDRAQGRPVGERLSRRSRISKAVFVVAMSRDKPRNLAKSVTVE